MRNACFQRVTVWLVLAAPLAFGSAESEAARLLLNEANSSYRQMRTERAVQLYREYLSRYPDRADVRVWLGAALLNMGLWDDAIAEARRALALDARNAKAYTLEGRVQAAEEKWSSASASFETALKLDPRDADAWYFAGRASFAEECFEKAVEQFSQTLKLGRAHSRVYTNLGQAFEAVGRTGEAEKAHRRAVDLAETEGSVSGSKPALAYGLFLFKQQRLTESVAMLRKAFLITPDEPEARFELGRALYQTGKLAEAAEILEGGSESRDCRILNLLSRVHRTQGRGADADRDLRAWQVCSQAGGR